MTETGATRSSLKVKGKSHYQEEDNQIGHHNTEFVPFAIGFWPPNPACVSRK